MNAAVHLKPQKPKLTEKGVRGKIMVQSEEGERIGQWGGTECFLSIQPAGLGPCLVVRSSRHKANQGTFFRLSKMKKLISTFVEEGKMTVVVEHQKRICTVYIETTEDIRPLEDMSVLLRDKRLWGRIERNVASLKSKKTSGVRLAALEEPEEDYVETRSQDMEEEFDEGEADPAGPTADPWVRQDTNVPAPVRLAEQEWTSEQRRATQLFQSGRNVFVTGAAGTGKTQWLLHLIRQVIPNSGTVYQGGLAITGTTGAAARLIGGTTVHSFAGIGRGEGTVEALLEKVKSRGDAMRAWRACQVLIIDEIGMLPAHIVTKLDYIARHVRKELQKPFGGIQVVVVGDFLQLPPVAKGGEEVKAAFASASWSDAKFAAVEFTHTFRFGTSQSNKLFVQCLSHIRRGLYTRAVHTVLTECLHRPLDERGGVHPTVVMARRNDVETHNQIKLDELEDPYFQRYASEDYAAYPGDSVDSEVSLPAVLTLKLGAQVVLLVSLQGYEGLTNGSLGVVMDFAPQAHGPSLPVIRFTTGEEVTVSPARMEVYGRDGAVRLARTQIPLQLAWALTVHRVQGMTLDMCIVKLDRSFFESGQAYVALSRVRTATDLSLSALDPLAIKAASQDAMEFYEKLFPSSSADKETLKQEETEMLAELAQLQKAEREKRLAEKREQRRPTKRKEETEEETRSVKIKKSSPERSSLKREEDDRTAPQYNNPNTSNNMPFFSDGVPQLTQQDEGESFAMSVASTQQLVRGLLVDDE
ncbi:UvrD/REP helicase N-terminal domain/AAA domain/PIF1-like helicase, putative [Angomonas deanei]|uniref:ATP-dependent DNA helicase n=1 Tax=Angomonas deanei TaxID=59799 RepID=A0A7G2CMH8_9TRYP|nr:UvrD/REP helicase N-terminal domain/AAA domain/PIF1-like helicase, putative [Angomonas deanei]